MDDEYRRRFTRLRESGRLVAAAAAALTTNGREVRVNDITGPELIDARRYLALFEEFGGRGIVHADANVDDADYERYGAAFAADPDNAANFELFTRPGPRNPDRLSEPSRDWIPATHRPAPTLHARALPTPPLVAPTFSAPMVRIQLISRRADNLAPWRDPWVIWNDSAQ